MTVLARPRRGAVAPVLVALVSSAMLLTSCSSGSSDDAKPSPSASSSGPGSSRFGRYVALGDSYSAGPLIPTTDIADGCTRSDHNYPSLLADRLGVTTFVDKTCSGASTADLTGSQETFNGGRIAPQLDAVTAGTDLVTIGIGGNDLDLFGTVVRTCTSLRDRNPTGSPCTKALARRGFDLADTAATIRRRVTASLKEIRRRAPHAVVVLVGYLRLAPDRGTCAALPLAAGDYAEGRRIARLLDTAQARAARQAGVRYVDMDAASRGHDACSADPWVNGSLTDREKALNYHPFAAGMVADADAVLAALGSR